MHIGLIGGIGPAATDYYYRRLINQAARLERDLDLTIAHADTPTLLGNLIANNDDQQIAIYDQLTRRLAAAGAECVVVTSIAGHFCIDGFAAISPLPVVDITKALAAWLKGNGMTTVGILGTETVMASAMYGKLEPVNVLCPRENSLKEVHEAYVALAQSGRPTEELTSVFLDAGSRMMERGAEAILLGGTDLNAAFPVEPAAFPIIDCAGIHIEEIATVI